MTEMERALFYLNGIEHRMEIIAYDASAIVIVLITQAFLLFFIGIMIARLKGDKE